MWSAEFTRFMSRRSGFSQKDVKRFLAVYADAIQECLRDGVEVRIPGVGRLIPKDYGKPGAGARLGGHRRWHKGVPYERCKICHREVDIGVLRERRTVKFTPFASIRRRLDEVVD
jgi:hypothetical protein